MHKITKAGWTFSILLYLAVLIVTYTALPDKVGFQAGADGNPSRFISKEQYFYFGLAIFVFVNGIGFALFNTLKLLPLAATLYANEEQQKYDVLGWFSWFVLSLNWFLMLAGTYITLFNRNDLADLAEYNFIVFLAALFPLSSILWLTALPVRALKRNKTVS
jgi:hypothetical protein